MHEFSIYTPKHPEAVVNVKADNPQHAIETLGLVIGKNINTEDFKFVGNNEILFRVGNYVGNYILKYQGEWHVENGVWKNSSQEEQK